LGGRGAKKIHERRAIELRSEEKTSINWL